MDSSSKEEAGEHQLDRFREALGPFVVAATTTRMPIIFTDAREATRPIIFVNDSFLKLVGHRREEVIGQPFNSVWLETVEPEMSAAIEAQFDDSQETLEVELRRADGGYVSAELCVKPVHDREGRVVQHFISFVDLSAQMARIRRERSALHVLYQHTPGFIALTEGADHRFTFANAAYHRLVGTRELLGRPVEESFPELEGQNILVHLDKVYHSGTPFAGEALAVRLQREPDAALETRFLDFLCQPVRDADGRITGIFWEGHDVTDQMEGKAEIETLQAELIHLTRVSAMGTMAATLAHELAQPLAAISNYAAACQLRMRAEGGSAALADGLTAITDSARRGGEIIHRMRDMTMRRGARREIFDLKDAVRESIALVRAATKTGVSITDHCAPGIRLEADRIQIQQVLMNLIRNACEAVSGAPGRVSVTTGVDDGMAVISIADSGKGVSESALKTLFTWSESAKRGGTGIGLSVCRTIVEAHHGKLWLCANGVEGACFSFSLPVWAGPARNGDPRARMPRAA